MSKLEHDLPVTGQCAFQIAFRLLELRLEARNIKARESRGAVGILLEGGIGHVGFLLIGVDDSQLEVLRVVTEVRFQLKNFSVGGCRFVIPARHEKYVAARVKRISIAGTNRHVAVIRCQRASKIARYSQSVGLKVQ